MSQTSRTSTNEHLEFIRKTMDRLHERGLVPGTQTVDAVIDHAAAMAQQLADVQEVCRNLSEAEREYEAEHGAMAAQIERLQRLWDAWGRSRGYATDSKPYGAFLDALKACEDHGDLLPLEGSNGR